MRPPASYTLFPYTTLFRSPGPQRVPEGVDDLAVHVELEGARPGRPEPYRPGALVAGQPGRLGLRQQPLPVDAVHGLERSEEHTSELQSQFQLVCRLLLEKK